jgi:hypothetical protein
VRHTEKGMIDWSVRHKALDIRSSIVPGIFNPQPFTMASALVTRLALSRVLGSTTTRTRPRLTCYWSRISHRVWAPAAHYSSHPKPVRFAYVRPRNEVRARLLSSDDIRKTIFAEDFPLFALDEDVRTLFEEANFPAVHLIMLPAENAQSCITIE